MFAPAASPTRPPCSSNCNNYYDYYHKNSRYGHTACAAPHKSLSSHTSSSSSSAYGSSSSLIRCCPIKGFSHSKDFVTNKGKPCIKAMQETVSQGSPQSPVEVSQEEKEANKGTLAERWREIQGLNHWEGLLDPLDLELRKSILFYGDLNQAVYDSFETDEHSKYTGACSSPSFPRKCCPTKAFSHSKDFITNKGKPCIKAMQETVSQSSPQSPVEASQEEKEGNQANKGTLAERWREIQGLNHWEGLLDFLDQGGLLDPLDLELRKSILFYGDLNQAVYDSFETYEHSKYTGAYRFTKEEFFERTGLVKGREVHYDMARYLYASSSIDMPGLVIMKSYSREAWSKESNWIGYVAVSNDEATKVLGRRDIVIVWRGTMRPFEWLDDFDFRRTGITSLLPPSSSQEKAAGDDKIKIEQGWLIIYTSKDSKSAFTSNSAREQVLNEVRCQMKKYKDEDVSITIMGHSLGAALAVVNAFDIALNGINLREGKEATLVTAIVCGCPGIGDKAFVEKCQDLEGLRVLRVKNKIDLITRYPGWLMGYKDVGDELLFDSRDSPYFKKSKNPGDWHNLEAHLHMVAGTQGVGEPFKLAVNRDVALINKSSEFLRDDYLIPGSWWQMQYKGLVQQDDGFWYMPDREEGKRPKPEPLNDL